MHPHQATGVGLGRHREVDLPVLVAHCRRHRATIVEERIACRCRRLAGQIVKLVHPVEFGLDDAGIIASHDLLVEVVAFGPAGDLDEGWHPVVRREHFVQDGAWLDFSRPADQCRRAHATFPGGQLAALERGVATIGIGDHFGAVVGGEDDDGVVEFAHRLQLLHHLANVVVHLLHGGFVGTPVLATLGADHGHVLVRQHGEFI